ncbi:histidine phosphatase family protein [Candidatus Aerophobetes bacterium]|nr:histidine phosphatase family protein [Candidatus Aerophobetes bacterium]
MSKLYIFLIRHGNTIWNRKKVFRGHLDIPLDKEGEYQAELTGKYLQQIKLNALYSSPLKRALKTAQIIKNYQAQDMRIVVCEGFKDLNYGKWQGKSHEEIKREYNQLYSIWGKEPEKVKIPGGETLKEAADRAWQALEEIILREKGVVGIVSHRVINKLLICRVLGVGVGGFWKIKQDTCCINLIQYESGRFTILKLNDTSHLVSLNKALETFDF